MNKKLIIFDFDGVLVDSSNAVVEYYTEMFESFGLPLPDMADVRVREDIFSLSHRNMVAKYAGVDIDSALYREMCDFIPKDPDYIFSLTQPMDGAVEMVPIIAERYTLAICTNRGESVAGYLRSFGLESYFSYIINAKDVSRPKPDPEGVLNIMTRFNVTTALFVGDSETDYYAAQAAGVPFVSFRSALFDSDVVYSFVELLDYISGQR